MRRHQQQSQRPNLLKGLGEGHQKTLELALGGVLEGRQQSRSSSFGRLGERSYETLLRAHTGHQCVPPRTLHTVPTWLSFQPFVDPSSCDLLISCLHRSTHRCPTPLHRCRLSTEEAQALTETLADYMGHSSRCRIPVGIAIKLLMVSSRDSACSRSRTTSRGTCRCRHQHLTTITPCVAQADLVPGRPHIICGFPSTKSELDQLEWGSGNTATANAPCGVRVTVGIHLLTGPDRKLNSAAVELSETGRLILLPPPIIERFARTCSSLALAPCPRTWLGRYGGKPAVFTTWPSPDNIVPGIVRMWNIRLFDCCLACLPPRHPPSIPNSACANSLLTHARRTPVSCRHADESVRLSAWLQALRGPLVHAHAHPCTSTGACACTHTLSTTIAGPLQRAGFSSGDGPLGDFDLDAAVKELKLTFKRACHHIQAVWRLHQRRRGQGKAMHQEARTASTRPLPSPAATGLAAVTIEPQRTTGSSESPGVCQGAPELSEMPELPVDSRSDGDADVVVQHETFSDTAYEGKLSGRGLADRYLDEPISKGQHRKDGVKEVAAKHASSTKQSASVSVAAKRADSLHKDSLPKESGRPASAHSPRRTANEQVTTASSPTIQPAAATIGLISAVKAATKGPRRHTKQLTRTQKHELSHPRTSASTRFLWDYPEVDQSSISATSPSERATATPFNTPSPPRHLRDAAPCAPTTPPQQDSKQMAGAAKRATKDMGCEDGSEHLEVAASSRSVHAAPSYQLSVSQAHVRAHTKSPRPPSRSACTASLLPSPRTSHHRWLREPPGDASTDGPACPSKLESPRTVTFDPSSFSGSSPTSSLPSARQHGRDTHFRRMSQSNAPAKNGTLAKNDDRPQRIHVVNVVMGRRRLRHGMRHGMRLELHGGTTLLIYPVTGTWWKRD